MNYPLISEYIEAIRYAEDNFDELSNLRPVLDGDGNPVMSSGNFAVVFKMTDGKKDYAIKCFTREQEGREEAYKQISEFLEDNHPDYFVSAQYLDKELFVSSNQTKGTEFPVLLMDWVEGEALDKFIEKDITNKETLQDLYGSFVKLAKYFIGKPFAHGDLKPDNIIVKEDGTIVLLDYDGMFVPSMFGQQARESGTPDYRHPMRSADDFDEHIDDYALVILCLCLRALVVDSTEFDDVFKDISNSIECMSRIKTDTLLMQLYAAYLIVLTTGRIEETSASLLINADSEYNYEREKQLLHEARQGTVSAMTQLGDLYYSGHIVPKDIGKAQRWYDMANRLGDVNAGCSLCCCYYHEHLCCLTEKEKIAQLNQLAANGVRFAECRMGECYEYANGVEKDYSKAVELYKKPENQNLAGFQWRLGICYEDGKGVEKNYSEAVKWFRKSAEQGHVRAQYSLADCYSNGDGVEQDFSEAFKWYKMSAEQGFSWSQYKIGKCYAFGKGVEQNFVEAAKWLKKSAEQNNEYAQYYIGNCYEFGHGVQIDYTEAVKWYKKSAEQGYSWAQLNLGKCYYTGYGVVKNFGEAVKWFAKSAEQDNEQGQYCLGVCYYKGIGVECDYLAAVKWFRKAAKKGHAKSQYYLGICYVEGKGIEQNIGNAVNHISFAADAGFYKAEILLDKICKEREINDKLNVQENELPQWPGDTNTGSYSHDGKRFLCYWGTYGEEYVVKEGTEYICNESFNDLYNETDGHYLETLYLPKTIKRIGNNVFCASITKIVCDSPNFIVDKDFLLSHDRKILYRYFGRNDKIEIPDGVKYIKGGAFSDRDDIKEVTIPESVIAVGDNPFAGWGKSYINIVSNSKRIKTISNLLYDIPKGNLIACLKSQKNVNVKDGTKIIGKNAFYWADIEILTLPQSIKYIDETAFYGCCEKLKRIEVYRDVYKLLPSYLKKQENIDFIIVDELPF